MRTKRSVSLLVVFSIFWMGLGMLSAFGQGVVRIPRAGFPYCQPFTSTGNPNDIPFTIARGNEIFNYFPLNLSSDRDLILTGNALQLTPSEQNQRGYVLIDLPFSSEYGIKASFEYFIHTPGGNGLGDGLSFFLIDGAIDASTFEIGGVGGSLGYAPHGLNSGAYTTGGVTGGYVGIGFDVLGNYGNFHEKKYGGFSNPNQFNFLTPSSNLEFYPDAISIRGPVHPSDALRRNNEPFLDQTNLTVDSYQFIDGLITYFDTDLSDYSSPGYYLNRVSNGSAALWSSNPSFFLGTSEQFKIGSGLRPQDTSCGTIPNGYRKVFIDLEPTGNPTSPYRISLDMLVDNNPTPVSIFNGLLYSDNPAPETLKIGFAASTGSDFYSIHEIRNVALQVSSIEEQDKPQPPSLFREVCIDQSDEVEFPFCVNLPSSVNAFIQCIQLFDTDPGPGNNDFTQDTFDCGLSPFCSERCLDQNKRIPVFDPNDPTRQVGELIAELSDEVEPGEFNQALIRYERTDLSFYGTVTAWYKIIDNFGLESDGTPITITVNPLPQILNPGVVQDPTCDGQSDGSLSNVVIDFLVPGQYTLEVENQDGDTFPFNIISETTNPEGYSTVTIDVSGLNLGDFFVEASNISNSSLGNICSGNFDNITDDDCDIRLPISTITNVTGTPVEVDLDDQEVCEGTPVVFEPRLFDASDATNPSFLWWKDANKTPGEQITDGQTEGPIEYNIDTNTGTLTITGLPQSGTPYEYFVEVVADPSQNLCATPAGSLKPVQVLVLPPLSLDATVSDDLCRLGAGQIVVNASGGFGTYEYSLDGGAFQSSNTFSGLLPGTYTIDVSAGSNCIGTITETIEGPAETLSITQLDQTNPSCGLENGIVTFEVAGGTPGYTFTLNGDPITPQLNGNTYTIDGLYDAPTHIIEVIDSNNCNATFTTSAFDPIPIPTFDATDAVICPGETAILTVQTVELSNATNLSYSWRDENGNPLSDGNGISYSANATTGELQITGLSENVDPYEFQVIVSGDNLCNSDPIPATVTVNPVPKILEAQPVNILCFGEATGSITFIPEDDTAGADYEYKLDKEATSWQGPVFNNLPSGTYSPEVRNTNTGCTTTLPDVTLTEPAEVLFDFDEVIQPACDEANGLIRVDFSGGVGPYDVELFQDGSSIRTENDASSPLEFRDLAPGDYEIRLTDDNGCPHSLNQQLINDVGIQISVDPMSDEICAGDAATILPVITTAGNPELTWYKDANRQDEISTSATPDADGLTFDVDASTMQLEVTGLQPGTYTYYLVAEGPGYCPNPPFEANITVLEPISATLAIENEACFDAGDGSIEVSASGSDGNFEYSINGGTDWQSTTLFSNLSPGTYTIDIRSTGGNDCVFNVSGEVLGTTPIAINAPDILRSSCGLSNGSIENLQISGGWGNYSVEWRQGSETGPVVSSDPTQAVDLAPDTYFLLITDDEGCPFVESFVLEEQPRPEFVIAPVEICAGEEVILTPVNTVSGSSGSDLVWYKDASRTQEISNGPDPNDPAVSYALDPDGVLTITGLSGDRDPYTYYLHVVCNDEMVPVDALVRTVPDLDFETDPEQCFGAEDGKIRIIAGADPLYEYSISGNNLTQAELEAAEYAPGTYTISVSNEGFCLQDFTVVVEGPDAPLEVDPLTQIDPGCGADIGVISTEVSGGWAPYEVTLFRDGSAIETSTFQGPEVEFDDLAPGDYYLTVTDAEGCVETSNTVTLVYGPTQVIIDDAEICEGEDAVLIPSINPSAPNPTYSWFKDAAATIPIVSDPNPDANGHIFQIAADGTLTISGLDASDSPQTYYATVSGTDVCAGFIGSAQVVINRIPSLSYAVSNEVCFGDNGTINLQGSAGDGTFEYSLNGNDWQSSGTFDVAPGIYTGYVRSGAGCIVSSPNIEVQGPSAPLSYSEPALVDPTCNTADGSISFTISGGYGNYSVEVTKDGASFGTFASPSGQVDLQDLESGSYSFLILDENPDGINCQLSIPAQIELEDLPTPLSASGVEICEGETASIQASTTQTGISPVFTWYQNANGTGEINNGTSGSVSYQINSSTGELSISGLSGQSDPYVYYVGISGNGVCEPELVPVEVFVYPIPNLRVSNPSIVCDPQGTVDLTQFIEGFNPNIYDYNIIDPTGGSMRMDEIDAVNLSGSYQVSTSLRGADCWSAEQRIQVIISDTELIPEFNYEIDLGGGNILANAEVQIQEPVQFQDVSLGKVIIWNWDFGDGSTSSAQNPSHEYQKKGSYTVTLTTIDEFGCVAEYQRVIQVFDDYIIMVPNAFTPDGTKNQYFKPQYRGIASMEFYIFNTWGELIFEANSLETMGWDGTLNGKKVPNGNYVYRAVFTTRSGEKEERSGVFVLIR